MDTRVNPVRDRIERVRQALARHGAQALLVPSADPHLSEYLPGRWQGREWLSGFTGSMGTLVVTPTQAALFADSRYWQQAGDQLLGSGIDLVKIPTGAATHHIEWLADHTPRGGVVRVDGDVLGLAAAQQLQCRARRRRHQPEATDVDVLADAWPDRPALPVATVYAHAAPQAPEPRAVRLARVREAMARHGASHHFVSTVDDIAWITNLRGSRRRLQPGLPGPPAGGRHPRHAVRRRRQGAGGDLAADLAADGLQLADYAQAGTGAECAAKRQHAAGRPAPHHPGLSPAGAGGRGGGRGHQPQHAVQEPQVRRRGAVRAPGHGGRRRGHVPLLCLVRGRAGPRRAHQRADHRREAQRRAGEDARVSWA